MYLILALAIVGAFTGNANGYGLIQNVREGACLATTSNGLANLEKMTLEPCDITSNRQLFNVLAMADYDSNPGFIRAKSGKCLDGNPDSGQLLYVYDCTFKANVQFWRILNGDYEGTFQLQNVRSNKCLQPGNGGATVQDQIECNSGSKYQYWRVIHSSNNLASVCSSAVHY